MRPRLATASMFLSHHHMHYYMLVNALRCHTKVSLAPVENSADPTELVEPFLTVPGALPTPPGIDLMNCMYLNTSSSRTLEPNT